jgi:hypothetical protein
MLPFLRDDDAREAHALAIDEAKGMNRMLNALLAATRNPNRSEPPQSCY